MTRDFLSTYDMTTVTMATSGCLLATTPLSPVHEAKEPRQKHPVINMQWTMYNALDVEFH
jgi:hypothetical protein